MSEVVVAQDDPTFFSGEVDCLGAVTLELVTFQPQYLFTMATTPLHVGMRDQVACTCFPRLFARAIQARLRNGDLCRCHARSGEANEPCSTKQLSLSCQILLVHAIWHVAARLMLMSCTRFLGAIDIRGANRMQYRGARWRYILEIDQHRLRAPCRHQRIHITVD